MTSEEKKMSQEITAPLSGKIIRLNVDLEDQVEEDQELMVVEAMKMETPVFSTCDGIVKEIRIKEGDDVEEDVVCIVIQES
jgi:biotin carboxyl carrier protein